MITLPELRSIKIFKDLPEDYLSALIPRLEEKVFPPGSTIIYRGDPGSSMFLLASGSVVVTLVNAEGIEYSIATIEKGDIFGEMSLMTGEPRSANVKAVSEVLVYVLNQDAFFELISVYPTLNDEFVQLLIQRQAKTAVQQQSAPAKRKGNIATLFAMTPPSVDHLTGKTLWAAEVNSAVRGLAETCDNLLIVGERGTGKGLAARLIHFNGAESNRPLLHLDCATPPPVQRSPGFSSDEGKDALHREIAQEAALFGHGSMAGSFAHGIRRGYMELADNGALIIENVHTLSSRIQKRLIEFLQLGYFVRTGDTERVSSKVRILATTTKEGADLLDPELLALLGRETLKLKPLRERKKDIPLLAEVFLKKHNLRFSKDIKGFSKEAVNLLVDYSWPLNADELNQVVERAVAVATGDMIEEFQVFLNVPTFSATGKYNVLRNPHIRSLADKKFFPTGLRYITTPFILFLILFTLLGPTRENPANLIVWGVWWPILIVSIIISGRAWCGYCPLPVISDGLNFFKKKFLAIPSFIVKNGVWVGVAGFALILLAENASHMFTAAQATGFLLVSILGGTFLTNFVFGKRAWCKHICPLGKMVSFTTPLSFVELDSNSTVCSSQCQTHDCVKDESCPMGLHPSAVANSNDCILCLACVKRCKHQAVRINARIPWREIQSKNTLDTAGAFFATMLAGLVLGVKLPSWGPIARWFDGHLVAMNIMAPLIISVTFVAIVFFASGFPGHKSGEQNFAIAGFSYLSLACAGFFNIYFHEFVYQGHNLGPWIIKLLGLNSIVPGEWVTPELGTLKMLIPLLTLIGAVSSGILLARLAKKHALPRLVTRLHATVLFVTTMLYLLIL